MILNYDCIRSILLFIEENIGYKDKNSDVPHIREDMLYTSILKNEYFNKYKNIEELAEAMEKLIEEGFLKCKSIPKYNNDGDLIYVRITGLTWSGHELLDNIRNDTIWNAVKEKTKKVGKVSIKAMASAASALGTALLTDPNAVQNFMNGAQNLVSSMH